MAKRSDRRKGGRHGGSTRGPSAPKDDRLWRRLHDACPQAVREEHTPDQLWEALLEKEPMGKDSAEAKRRRSGRLRRFGGFRRSR